MAKLTEKIIKVEFTEPIDGKSEYYFGSLSAIYDVFTREQMGCVLYTLWNASIKEGKPYKNKRCTVSKFPIRRKCQKKL